MRAVRGLLGADGRKALRLGNKAAAEIVAAAVPAQQLTPQQRRMAARVKAGADLQAGLLRIANTVSAPFAVAAFMGTKKRTGWYARPRYRASRRRQFQPWVGQSRPRPIDAAIDKTWPAVEARYLDALADAFDKA